MNTFNLVLILSYCFIYVRHFLLPEDVYARNLSHIFLAGYGILAFMDICFVLAQHGVEKNNTEEENAEHWKSNGHNSSCTGVIYDWVSWPLIIGLGVIGRWYYFAPLIIMSLCWFIYTSNCKDRYKEYQKKNNMPVEAKKPTKKVQKASSRYNLIKG